MSKKLIAVLVELAVAVLAGYIVVFLTTSSTRDTQAPAKQEPHLIQVQAFSDTQLDDVAKAVSKTQTEEQMRCADA